MSAGVNKVIIVGNLGKDPEVRYGQSGNAVCNISVAVNERVKKGDEWVDHTEWFRVTTFGKTAENVGQYLSKGRQVYVEGRKRESKYKDKDGVERTSFDVIAETIQFLGGGEGKKASAGPPSSRPAATSRAAPSAPPPDDGFIDDDLPF